MKRTTLFFIFLFILSGCTYLYQGSCIYQLTPIERVSIANLDEHFMEIASEICSKPGYSIIIPDFIEINTFSTGKIGLLLSELMRSYYSQQCKNEIVQVEFPKHFKLTQDGLIALTRNPDELKKKEHKTPEAIIGTYSYTDNNLRIFVRKIDTENGKIIKMTSREIRLPNCQ